ncbi:MAG TPA: hypothetical protein VK609_14765, partial [Mucilaginibacter sp.]|nr:hypothetical protein [Mucilaginibacter sp.]
RGIIFGFILWGTLLAGVLTVTYLTNIIFQMKFLIPLQNKEFMINELGNAVLKRLSKLNVIYYNQTNTCL